MNICTDLNTRYTRLNENTRKLVKKPQSKKLINNEYKKDTLSKAESKLQDDKFQTPFFEYVLCTVQEPYKIFHRPTVPRNFVDVRTFPWSNVCLLVPDITSCVRSNKIISSGYRAVVNYRLLRKGKLYHHSVPYRNRGLCPQYPSVFILP